MAEKVAEKYSHLTSMAAPLLKTEFSSRGDGEVESIGMNEVLTYGDTGEKLHNSNSTHLVDRTEHNAGCGTVYDDFYTIDWVRDRACDKERHRRMKDRQKSGWKAWFEMKWDAMSGWVVVFLVGVCCGVLAGVIDIGAAWMSDLKEGICIPWPYYDREACCWLTNQTSFAVNHCDYWETWAEQGGARDNSPYYSFNWFDYFIYIIFAMVFGGLSGYFVVIIAPYAAGSGIPEVKTILSGFIIKGYLGAWTLLIKCLGMVLSVGAGLSLGKEGPLVHVACCCGNLLTDLFPKYRKNEAKKREVLSAAAAAGVSVAFGAPVGGVLFSLEEVSYYFPYKTMWRSFFAALTAAFILRLMNPYFNGQLVLFYANYSQNWHMFEFIPFMLLGVFGGLYGALFIKLNLMWSRFRKNRLAKFPLPIVEVVIVSLLTGIISYPNEYTRMNASALIQVLFSQCGPEDNNDLCKYNHSTAPSIQQEYHDVEALPPVWRAAWQLMLAMLAKAILTVFTFGMKVPAGLFIPTMFVGACVGRVLGIGIEQLAYIGRNSDFIHLFCTPYADCVNPGLYAMIGAAATLGGVTRMTVSLVVIMFELTGGLNYIVPIMVAVMISKWVADAFIKDGIYDAHIHLRGYPFIDSKDEYNHDVPASQVMRPQKGDPPLNVLDLSTCTVQTLEDLIKNSCHFGFPCVMSMESQLLAGFITRKEITDALEQAHSMGHQVESESRVVFRQHMKDIDTDSNVNTVNLKGFMDESGFCRPCEVTTETMGPMEGTRWESPFQISDQTQMETVVEMFRKMGLRQLLVTHNARLVGIITKKDMLKHVAEIEHQDPNAIHFD